MTNENNSVTLEFLGKQMERMFSEIAGLKAGQAEVRGIQDGMLQTQERLLQAQDRMQQTQAEQGAALVKLIDAVSAIAQMQEQHSVLLGKLHESHKIVIGRLNVMDARLGHLEKHAGFVDV